MSQSTTSDPPDIPEGDPEEWSKEERRRLYEFVADLDISEDANAYFGSLADMLREDE